MEGLIFGNACGLQGENEKQSKKGKRNTYGNIFFTKHVTRKFHLVVMQNNGKEMYKKCAAYTKLFFANYHKSSIKPPPPPPPILILHKKINN